MHKHYKTRIKNTFLIISTILNSFKLIRMWVIEKSILTKGKLLYLFIN